MSITVKTLKTKVINYLQKYNITDTSKILVAYSGGPDSSALLWLLNDIRETVGYSLHGLYVNHGIRSKTEMIAEVENIKNISKKINIKIEHKDIEYGFISAESVRSGRSIEDLAREYRYLFLEKMKESINATHIAMGHTLDDHIETLIMRFFQGSGINGLSGIPEKREHIIRPLMEIEKEELNDYLISKSIPYVVDKTNMEPVYLRNKVRLNLIPVISEIFPGYKKSLNSFSIKMDMVRTVLSESNIDLEINMTKDGDTWFSSESFSKLSDYHQIEILYKSWNMWRNRPFERLPYKFISNAVGADSGKLTNILLDGYSCRLIKQKELIIWKRVVVVSSKKSYLKVITVGNYKLFQGFYLKVEENTELSNDNIWFDRNQLRYPILVRSNRPGDRISLSEGMKSLKRLYSDWGILPEERWKIPVIEDRTGIIAVLGKSFSYSNRIAINYKESKVSTEILVISVKKYGEYK